MTVENHTKDAFHMRSFLCAAFVIIACYLLYNKACVVIPFGFIYIHSGRLLCTSSTTTWSQPICHWHIDTPKGEGTLKRLYVDSVLLLCTSSVSPSDCHLPLKGKALFYEFKQIASGEFYPLDTCFFGTFYIAVGVADHDRSLLVDIEIPAGILHKL